MDSSTADPRFAHAARVRRLQQALREGGPPARRAPLALAKATSNLFRHRPPSTRRRLDLGEFVHVLAVDPVAGWVDAEGLVDYETLADATLACGVVPAVVPELKSITVGGAIAGVAIEASSFRHGLVHETLLEADVLLADGRVVSCRPDGPHRDLFFGLANSYGTLGYVLRARLKTVPARACVAVDHHRLHGVAELLAAMDTACADPSADFVEGVVFGADDGVLTVARWRDRVPAVSDYTGLEAYHASLRTTPLDGMTARDWLWRWDTDWFWCSRHFGADRRWVRRLLGPARLNSRTYARWMRLAARWHLGDRLARLRGARHVESVVQDVQVPRSAAEDFLGFLLREIGIVPIWVCPTRAAPPGPAAPRFPLFPLRAGERYLNLGFWDTVERPEPLPPAHFNRRVERSLLACGGLKALYSDAFFTRAEFDALYGADALAALKARYDPACALPGLYAKTVLGA